MHAPLSKRLLLKLSRRYDSVCSAADDDDDVYRHDVRIVTDATRRQRRSSDDAMTCCNRNGLLIVTTSVCACASFAFLCVAVATDHWLHMQERMKDENRTDIYTNTSTGLWKKCVSDARKSPRTLCSYINYFDNTDRDGLGPAATILLSMRRSTIFPLVSLIILLTGEILCFIGHCNHQKKILTLVSGILFVVGGLVTLIGIIIFIGAITEEVGNKKSSSLDKPHFSYQYGTSFILTIGAFVLSETTGVLSVYLYISRYKLAHRRQQEHVTIVDVNDQHATLTANSADHVTRLNNKSLDRADDAAASLASVDNYYTYTPVADYECAKEPSNYTLGRDQSRNTVSTYADTHMSKDCSVQSVREMEAHRRTTPV